MIFKKEWGRKGWCPNLRTILPFRGVTEETMKFLSKNCLSPEAELESESSADVAGAVTYQSLGPVRLK